MSPTLLQPLVAIIAAVLVFLFALRVVPIVIEQLSHYFDRTIEPVEDTEKEPQDYER